MEAPVYSDSEEESDESICILPEDLQDEVDINIHFHCEHCIKLSKCQERPKPGWCCDIIECIYGCGIKFHACKLEEHELLCSHVRVPCLNAGYGCPHVMQRHFIPSHLPICPASVIVCNAEWNRWALGARERERITSAKGSCSLFEPTDLDMSFALNDQMFVNDMHSHPRYLRQLLCNGITKRFPILPLTVRGSYHEDHMVKHVKDRGRSCSTTDEEEEGLTPGLSLSVCSELLKGKRRSEGASGGSLAVGAAVGANAVVVSPSSLSPIHNSNSEIASSDKSSSQFRNKKRIDDITDLCCSHGILKDLCKFCKDDPDEPDLKYGNVWREKVDLSCPGQMSWAREPRVEKIRKRGPLGQYSYKRFDESDEDEESESNAASRRNSNLDSDGQTYSRKFRLQTPPPAPLTPKGLVLEIGLKHYSRHQVKPKAMFTFQCMQELRRDEFCDHFQNVHSEIQEGLDGWLIQRCPMHVVGCPFSVSILSPGELEQNRDVIFSHSLRSFGIRTTVNDSCHNVSSHSRSPSTEKSASSQMKNSNKVMCPIFEHADDDMETKYMASGLHITYLPFEVLQRIARNLDGFSLNSLSLSCRLMREVCFSLLEERGLIIQEWIRSVDEGKIHWRVGRNKWFYSKSFEHVEHWRPKNQSSVANHLLHCPFTNRKVNENKFCYLPKIGDEIKRQYNNMHKRT